MKFLETLKLYVARVLGALPSKTPIGRAAFDLWASSIFDTYGLPNTPGYRQALATMIMHEKRYFVSKLRFALQIKKAQVNETAYQLMKEIQEEKKQALGTEDTAPSNGVGNGKDAGF